MASATPGEEPEEDGTAGGGAACLMRLGGVRRTFLMGEVEVPVLRGVDMEVREGEFLAILGESGSGKTTLMNLIGGIDRADAGEVLYRGRDLTRLSDAELTRFRRSEVGFVFQLYNLVPTLTAEENVQAAAELVDRPMDSAEALGLVGLGDRLEHFPSQLSGGEQQRVAIARAVAKRPSLLLCDEPTGALDHETSRTVLRILGELNRKVHTTMVLVTHDRSVAALADRVVTIVDGEIAETRENR